MIKKNIKQLTSMITVENDVSAFYDYKINGVAIDSRKVANGELFVPLKGEQTDGHRFVEKAIEQGAGAALWQKDVPNPPEGMPVLIVHDTLEALQQLAKAYRDELNLKVVGVTGSNGKTTTKDMIASLLGLKYKVQKTEGNYNNHIGLPLTILSIEEETEAAVLEMGMSGRGEIDLLTRIASPEVAVITNIGESHLQDLGSREGIAEAKLEIVNGLKHGGTLIYHGDEPLLSERIERMEGLVTKTFGLSKMNDVYPISIQPAENGSFFQVNVLEKNLFLPVLGRHNILNALAAMSVAYTLGVPFEKMSEGLEAIELTKMRMELTEGMKGIKIINDAYNASPTSTRAAIELVSQMPGFERKIVVLGDMLELGPDEETFHFDVGREIDSNYIDHVFTYGRLGSAIAKGAKAAMPHERVHAFSDKQELIKELMSLLSGGELVLVKASRGMRLEEVVESLTTGEITG
ncbi:MAG TPA: UDP-N-acetylmuramoyl-tripeptide--D-alanyl-D-alanine ligase [Chondromyces sp.]|nr:UDP-N-acetylmuramoyl-tripeptide--D-alanyl-D-alanine ligase [Chondromyces sp.]